jgi:hypothetical protein
VNQGSTHDTDKRRQDEGREVRARCWAYIFACFEAKRKAEQSSRIDEKEDEHATLKIHTSQCCGSVLCSPTVSERYALSRCWARKHVLKYLLVT